MTRLLYEFRLPYGFKLAFFGLLHWLQGPRQEAHDDMPGLMADMWTMNFHFMFARQFVRWDDYQKAYPLSRHQDFLLKQLLKKWLRLGKMLDGVHGLSHDAKLAEALSMLAETGEWAELRSLYDTWDRDMDAAAHDAEILHT